MKTKKLMKVSLALIFMAFTIPNAQGQLLKKIGDRVVNTAENKVINKAGNTTSRGIDEVEAEVTGKNKKKKENKPASKKEVEKPIVHANYDFVPGSKLIYFYDMAGERDADIPAKMLLDAGNVSVQTYKNAKVLTIPANDQVWMKPLVHEKNYLPQQYTIEFDVMTHTGNDKDLSQISIYLRGKNENSGNLGNATAPIVIKLQGISGDANSAKYEFMVYKSEESKWIGTSNRNLPLEAVNSSPNTWRHVAIYVNDNVGKLYVDQHRIGVLNQINPGEAAQIDFEIETQDAPVLMKNFRIATQ